MNFPARHEPPLTVITPRSGGLSLKSLREFIDYREVLGAFTTRIVKIKYKQAALGFGWAVLQPLIATALLAVFLGRFVKVPSEGLPYLPFALSGMVLWTYFAGAVNYAMDSIVRDQGLIRKIYFPREILPAASVLAFLVDLACALPLLLAVVLVSGIHLGVFAMLFPIPIILLVETAAAAGLLTAAFNVFYRDVKHILPFLLQLGLLASPIVYPASVVPAQWRTLYQVLNPIAAAIDAFRRTVLHDEPPDWLNLLAAFVVVTILLVSSLALFKRMERQFADRV